MTVDFNTFKTLGLASSSSTSTDKKRNELTQDDFMKLLTTQLQHQDPLKPQDSAEFMSQMAQFSTVNGIQELQKSMTSMTDSTQQQQSILAGSLVGKSALVASNKALLPATGSVQGQLILPESAQAVTVQITDASGDVVKTLDLGDQSQGSVPFYWNGQRDDGQSAASPGVYQLKALGSVGGKSMALETRVASPVDSVSLGGAKGMQVNLAGLGGYGMRDVYAIL